jgi:hypothetical protein
VLLAELVGLGEVSLIGDEDTGLTLNGLDEESGNVGALLLEIGLESGNIVEGNTVKSREIRSEALLLNRTASQQQKRVRQANERKRKVRTYAEGSSDIEMMARVRPWKH